MRDLDESLFFLVYRAAPPFPWLALMVVLSILGGGYALFGIVPLAFVARTKKVVRRLLVALTLTSVVVYAAKHTLQRPRPYVALNGVGALGLPAPHDPSLPSGHAAGSACFAAFFANRKRPLRTALLGGAALLVGVSRIALGVHFPLDVLAGVFVGTTFGAGSSQYFAHRDT
jgi:undecaprenyl-diphosphatase